MEMKGIEYLTEYKDGYRLASIPADDGYGVSIVVLNEQNEVVKPPRVGKEQGTIKLRDWEYFNSVEPFKKGVAVIDYSSKIPAKYSAIVGVTKSGYEMHGHYKVSKAREYFDNPEKLLGLKFDKRNYEDALAYIDIVEHAFELKGKEFEGDPKKLTELAKLAKRVTSHLAREFERNVIMDNLRRNMEEIRQRIDKLLGRESTYMKGGE